MSSSKNQPQNTSSTTTNASETNLSASGTSGVTLIGNKGSTSLTSNTKTSTVSNSGNTSITYDTDAGAVAAGTALGHAAIAANENLSESLASDYENEVNTSAVQSSAVVQDALNKGFNFLADENATIQSIEQQNATNLSEAYGNYATTLSGISTAQDTSLATQSTQFASQTFKLAAVVILGVALIYFASRSA